MTDERSLWRISEAEKIADEKRRRKEWEVLEEKSKSSLIRCHKCPIWSLCSHQKKELSRDLEFDEEYSSRHTAGLYPPSQHKIDKFRYGLEAMRKVYGNCPLRKTMTRWL